MNQTEIRKKEHVDISLNKNASSSRNYWDDIDLIHDALPEVNENEIDLSTELFDKKLDSPVIIAGMTGGFSGALKINKNLAKAAAEFQIGMGVGSQRSGLENHGTQSTYSVIKEYDIPLRIANIGASQIVEWDHKKNVEISEKLVDMIDADVIAVCLNFLQEVVQPEGEANAKGCYQSIKRLAEEISTPVIVKETGAGISYEVAERLATTDVAGIDVGGAGGTSFAAIEYYRAKQSNESLYERCGKTFWDWGLPTPVSLVETGEATKWKIPIVATGGIRHGLDVAKALALGASGVGVAHALLEPASTSEKATCKEIQMLHKELRTAMFLVGASHVSQMTKAGVEVWI